jgi:hypothetical protein
MKLTGILIIIGFIMAIIPASLYTMVIDSPIEHIAFSLFVFGCGIICFAVGLEINSRDDINKGV